MLLQLLLQQEKKIYIEDLFFSASLQTRLSYLVPPTRTQRLWVQFPRGRPPEARDALRRPKRSRGEKWGVGSVPRHRRLSPQQTSVSSEKFFAHKLSRRWPQMWPGALWSLGSMGLDEEDSGSVPFYVLHFLITTGNVLFKFCWIIWNLFTFAESQSIMFTIFFFFRVICSSLFLLHMLPCFLFQVLAPH